MFLVDLVQHSELGPVAHGLLCTVDANFIIRTFRIVTSTHLPRRFKTLTT